MAKYPYLQVVGTASINGVNPTLLTKLNQIGQASGHVITINSGYRSPDYNDSPGVGGYRNDPHARGEAVDAYVGGTPIGDIIPLSTFQRYGLEGGNQPGFYKGGTDSEHVQIPGSGLHKEYSSPTLSQATGVPSRGNIPPKGLKDGTDPTVHGGSGGSGGSSGGMTVQDAQDQFAQEVAKRTGLSPEFIQFWANREGAYAPNGTGGFNFLNLRPGPGDVGVGGESKGKFDQFKDLESAVTSTVNRIHQPFLWDYLSKAGSDPVSEWNAIKQSQWDIGHYAGVEYGAAGPAPGGSQPLQFGGSTGTDQTQQTQQTSSGKGTMAKQTKQPKPPVDKTGQVLAAFAALATPRLRQVLPNDLQLTGSPGSSLPTQDLTPFVPKPLDFSQIPQTATLGAILPKTIVFPS